MYESLSTNGVNHFSDIRKKQMLQNALDNVDDFRNIHTVSQQTGKATTFEDYKALVHSAADGMIRRVEQRNVQPAIHTAMILTYMIQLTIFTMGMILTLTIDMIYDNAANTHEGMISSNRFCQMTPEGHKIWISLPPKDCKLILEQDSSSMSTPTDSFGSTHGQGSSHGCGAFTQPTKR